MLGELKMALYLTFGIEQVTGDTMRERESHPTE